MMGKREWGSASAWALCLLFFVVMAGMSLAMICYAAQRTTREYQHEMRLELAAESRLEEFAAAVERDAKRGDTFDEGKEEKVGVSLSAGAIPIESWVVVKRQGARLYCVAVARERDVDSWNRRRTVRGMLEKKEGGYVWIGWRP